MLEDGWWQVKLVEWEGQDVGLVGEAVEDWWLGQR